MGDAVTREFTISGRPSRPEFALLLFFFIRTKPVEFFNQISLVEAVEEEESESDFDGGNWVIQRYRGPL